ncbi:MAG: 6-bladed beta-propeller [Phycisphaerae bacterium]|nr:6-bladed beta-propeller [Phycisphaerae bacterium]
MRARIRIRSAFLVLLPAVLALVLWAGMDGRCGAAEKKVEASASYKVDPSWPKRPDNIAWGQTPGVAVDDKDQVWVFTRAKPPIQIYDAGGKFIRAWGHRNIRSAHQIKFDSKGNVWLADMGSHVVMQFTPEGKLLKTLGTVGKAGCDETHMNKPTDMAVTPKGEVFVSDGYGNSRVVHFDAAGKFVKAWGKRGEGPGQFDLPHAVALDSKGTLYVADRNNGRVQVFNQSGKFLAQWKDVLIPWGFCMTTKDELWACGSSPMARPAKGYLGVPPKDQVFVKFDRSGKVLARWTAPKGKDGEEKPGEVNWVHAIAVDSKGNIYAGDIQGKRAQKFIRQD